MISREGQVTYTAVLTPGEDGFVLRWRRDEGDDSANRPGYALAASRPIQLPDRSRRAPCRCASACERLACGLA